MGGGGVATLWLYAPFLCTCYYGRDILHGKSPELCSGLYITAQPQTSGYSPMINCMAWRHGEL